jgi:hypothetical protein
MDEHENTEAIRADWRAAFPNGTPSSELAAAFMVSLAILRASDRVVAELALIRAELERHRL